jgi:hypothetical protein
LFFSTLTVAQNTLLSILDDTMKKTVFLMIALFAWTHFLSAQTWTKTIAASNDWQCIASSADGTRLVAGQDPGPLYISTNSGTTWMPTIVSNEFWNSVASSADGTKLLAAAPDNAPYNSGNYPGGIYLSTNAGCTWISNSLSSLDLYWGGVASSADGNTLVVVAPFASDIFSPGAVFSSTDAGTTWVSNNLNNITSVAVSADGTKMVAVGFQVWLSTNSGVTWMSDTSAPAIGEWNSISQYIASSADGNKLMLCVLPSYNPAQGQIYISTNFGDAWNLTSAPGNYWNFVASSADGNTLLAAPVLTRAGFICLSTNSGVTWSTNNSPFQDWGALASSADGGKLVAAAAADVNDDVNSGVIYTSQSIQSPSLNLTPISDSLALSWLIPSTNFVLQQSPDLINWQEVTNTPILNLNNLQDEVVLSSTNNLGFYRLKTP